MDFKEFIAQEGLKKMALIHLKSASFSLLIYLYNEIVSGINEIISSKKELSVLLGWNEKQISDAIHELKFRHLIQVTEIQGKPLRLKPQLNFELWNLTSDEKASTFEPELKSNLFDNLEPKSSISAVDLQNQNTPIPFPKFQKEDFEDTFAPEIENKNLNDFLAFKEKNEAIDQQIRQLAIHEMEKIQKEERTISKDEELLLHILIKHHQPRKQLAIAVRSNLYYPNLKSFLNMVSIFSEKN